MNILRQFAEFMGWVKPVIPCEVGSLWVERDPTFTSKKLTIYKVIETGPEYLDYAIVHDEKQEWPDSPAPIKRGYYTHTEFQRRFRPYHP